MRVFYSMLLCPRATPGDAEMPRARSSLRVQHTRKRETFARLLWIKAGSNPAWRGPRPQLLLERGVGPFNSSGVGSTSTAMSTSVHFFVLGDSGKMPER